MDADARVGSVHERSGLSDPGARMVSTARTEILRSLSYQLFTVFLLTLFELVYETGNLLEEVP